MSDGVFPSPTSSRASHGTPAYPPSPTTTDTPIAALSRPSSARALVPTPLNTNLTPKPTVATASSPRHASAHASPVGGGPASGSYVVPPRPKPGRKPATDEPASKRKAQNRESQRAFRARKAAKLNEMQAQVDNAELEHKRERTDMLNQLQAKDARIRELEGLHAQLKEAEKRTAQECDFWKSRCAELEGQHQMLERQFKEQSYPMTAGFGDKQAFFPVRHPGSAQHSPRGSATVYSGYNTPKATDLGCGNCNPDGECACLAEIAKATANPYMNAVPLPPHMPPRTSISPTKGIQMQAAVDVFAEREIDFTSHFKRVIRPDQRPSIAFLTTENAAELQCGFCTDPSNCFCKEPGLLDHSTDEVVPASHGWNPTTSNAANIASNEGVTAEPGSCPDCQTNPRQRAWCQRVAQLKGSGDGFPLSPTSRNSSISGALETMEPRITDASSPYRTRPSIGCSEAYKLLDGRVPMEQDKMNWISNLKTLPSTTRRDTMMQPSRKYSALELDTAGVIATLGSTMQPLKVRPSDGENAPLVLQAQEFQRSSNSPRSSDSPMPASSLVNNTNISDRGWG